MKDLHERFAVCHPLQYVLADRRGYFITCSKGKKTSSRPVEEDYCCTVAIIIRYAALLRL
ncbi:hypothetical protein FRACYDRAFT_272520 [Fragilariopsis cylindrus CCMP1102]|uniref:Uncharacterized protein n=1 Tax=Fragilariopsis cylindrus CCMP1102 TaxID=635003 RepID=A0A1E7ELG6_9STRA|nr:hypothetical protein FRACYDRAFT_272520 [Fragilariopsis cylindrus CCMP1102]|eukprot:OEU06761.1 hypothetical protein FRACYDRAFT_272520 [Fragilariopsis cylindrus CCMP1102]